MRYYFVDRKTKIKKFDDLSILNGNKPGTKFSVRFPKKEIYCFQLALICECDCEIKSVKVSGKGKYTCINTDGIDNKGQRIFSLLPKMKKDNILPLFIMMNYTNADITDDNVQIQISYGEKTDRLTVEIKLTEEYVENFGYNDLKRLSRLEWLNSDKAIDEKVPKPFLPIKNNGLVFEILGRRITFGENALPERIESYFSESVELCDNVQCELLKEAVKFNAQNADFKIIDIQNQGSNAIICSMADDENFCIKIKSVLRYEGSIDFSITVNAKKNIIFDNLSFSYCLTDYAARYMNGFSKIGGKYENFSDSFRKGKQFDCLFCGNINTGIRVKFKAENYVRPFCNIYYHNRELEIPKTTWDNYGNGKIDVCGTNVCFNIGEYKLQKNETRHFNGELHITPFKAIDYKKHYETRYYQDEHLKNIDDDIKEAANLKFNYITYHHGTPVNPYINYPFVENKALKAAVEKAKEKGINTKIYYTVRECSNHMEEIFAYKALGDEIIVQKKGDGVTWQGGDISPWIKEYFGENVIPAWKVHFDPEIYKSDDDAAMIVSPGSRLENYYIEGLEWLVKNIGIKGIYIDDTALGRCALERARKILEPCGGLIDMHTWNHHNDWAGNPSSLNLYTEILPFIDSMWIGEDFEMSNTDADFIMTEMSAMPYGLTSQMLGRAKNIYVGLLYAMNIRFKWCDYTYEVYRLWDDFEIEESKMYGYWHSQNPVYTGDDDVKCTVYLKRDKAMLCLYNFSLTDEKKIKLNISSDLLGFDYNREFEIPEIKGYQQSGKSDAEKNVKLSARGGMVLYVSQKQ